jgi:cytidylate kinase
MARLIIAIDGPAAAGKSTVAKALAQRYHLTYLDSGALYRAMAWKVLQKGMDVMDEPQVVLFCNNLNVRIKNGGEGPSEVWVDSENVTPFLRQQDVTRSASFLSTYSGVRQKLLSLQREIATEGVVAEGRDMGTVVFPAADLKFYLDADISVRGRRRLREFESKGVPCDIHTVIDDIEKRDDRDQHRDVAPLYPAPDAMIIDTTALSLEEVIAVMEEKIKEKRDFN